MGLIEAGTEELTHPFIRMLLLLQGLFFNHMYIHLFGLADSKIISHVTHFNVHRAVTD